MKTTSRNKTNIHPRMERFLHEWAEWECRQCEGFGNLTSPMMILLASAQEDFQTKVFGFKEPLFNETANRFSNAINNRLERESPEKADALRILYLAPSRFRPQLIEERNVSKRAIFYRARAAKIWLTYWMKNEPFFSRYH